jgi:hypothetical protein
MEAELLNDYLKYLAEAGSVTLNICERTNIELALATVQSAYHFEHMHLWGKINGKLIIQNTNRFRSRRRLLRDGWNELQQQEWLP